MLDDLIKGHITDKRFQHNHHYLLACGGNGNYAKADLSNLGGYDFDGRLLSGGIRMLLLGPGPVPPKEKQTEYPLRSLESFRPIQEILTERYGYTFQEHNIPLAHRL